VISYLADWVRQIAIVVIVAGFLEMLVPDNGIKRYVKVAMGLFILLMILTPVMDLLRGRLAPDFTLGLPGGGRPVLLGEVEEVRDHMEEEILRQHLQAVEELAERSIRDLPEVESVSVHAVRASADGGIGGFTVRVVESGPEPMGPVVVGARADGAKDELARRIRSLLEALFGVAPEEIEVIFEGGG